MKAKIVYSKTISLEMSGRNFFTASVVSSDAALPRSIKVSADFPGNFPGTPMVVEGTYRISDKGSIFYAKKADFDNAPAPEDLRQFLKNLGFANFKQHEISVLLKISKPYGFFSLCAGETAEDVFLASALNPEQIFGMVIKVRKLVQENEVYKVISRTALDNAVGITRQIVGAYPDNGARLLKTEPYRVQMQLGLNFKVIDRMALQNGIAPLSEARLDALIYNAVMSVIGSGSTCVSYPQIASRVRSLNKSAAVKEPLTDVILKGRLKEASYLYTDSEFPEVYYTKALLDAEMQAVQLYVRLQSQAVPIVFHPEIVDQVEKASGHSFGQHQREAFQLLTETGVQVMNGDPGTGKTTTLRSMLEYLSIVWPMEFGRELKCCVMAPSGRAAQRAGESTGRSASTIHKVLRCQPDDNGGFTCRGEEDPIDADVIVVDEASMIGLDLFVKLMRAIRPGSLLLLIGDPNQLQSVDAGNVLNDILECGYSSTVHLTQVFRQAGESLISVNAKKIIDGDPGLLTGKDFKVIQVDDPEDTKQVLMDTVKESIRACGGNTVQVLSPTNSGSCGTREGNKALVGIFNSEYSGRKRQTSLSFFENDRVIFLRNNYKLGYFNGDVGYVTGKTAGAVTVKVGADSICVPPDNLGDVALAYICTIHKSQGSEYDNVIIVLQKEAEHMLDRNLLYTAVTRARKTVTIIAEKGMLNKAVSTTRLGTRNTHFVARLNLAAKEREAKAM